MHTAYFTAVADEQGKVTTFADIYKIDPPVAAAIIGKQAKPEAVADNVETARRRQAQAGAEAERKPARRPVDRLRPQPPSIPCALAAFSFIHVRRRRVFC